MEPVSWVERSLRPPEEQPEAWSWERVALGSIRLWIIQPRDPDQLLDDEGAHEASQRSDYMPYWAYRWSSSEPLARWLIDMRQAVQGKRLLELGCGLAVPGLTAGLLGAHVTLNDHSLAALAAARTSAQRNGLHVKLLPFDWANPPERPKFDLIIAADVLYEGRHPRMVARCIARLLKPAGVAWIADPHRSDADKFPEELRQQGLECTVRSLDERHRLFCAKKNRGAGIRTRDL